MFAIIARKGIWISLAAGLVASCSQRAAIAPDVPSLTVSGLNGTTAESAVNVKLSVDPVGDGYVVSLAPGNVPLGRELYLALDYDAVDLHAEDIQAQSGDDALALAVEPEPGHIEFGVVSTSDKPLSVDSLFSFKLAPGAPARAASATKWAANATEIRPRFFALEFDNDWNLCWDYTNPGDTNQNSIVGVDDLSPLGANYRVGIGPGLQQPLRNVDCDRNGEINISDLTPIGVFFRNDVTSYLVQASADGLSQWNPIGEVALADQTIVPGQAVRFTFPLAQLYAPDTWYRVKPLTHEGELGEPSQAICSERRILDTNTSWGEHFPVVVSAFELPGALRMMNSVRLIYPDSYTYMPYTYNIGGLGGDSYEADGIWGTFAEDVIRPPDEFYYEVDRGDGFKHITFNVSVTESFYDYAPYMGGDLFNFILWNNGSDDHLILSTEALDQLGYKCTYFSDHTDTEYFFGNSLSFEIY